MADSTHPTSPLPLREVPAWDHTFDVVIVGHGSAGGAAAIEAARAGAETRDQLDYATAELSTYQTGRVRKLLDDAIQAALTGTKSPGDALVRRKKQSDRLLEQYPLGL